MPSVRIILLFVFAAILYGILHDQITARICIEYFTVGHPRIFPTENPTLLAFGWGVIATWWMGLLLGIPVAFAARAGRLPKLTAALLVRPLIITLLLMGLCALAAGIAGDIATHRGIVVLDRWGVPPQREAAFIADYWAHLASYASGVVGGIALCFWVAADRVRRFKGITSTEPPANV